jgi:hypothetical protein
MQFHPSFSVAFPACLAAAALVGGACGQGEATPREDWVARARVETQPTYEALAKVVAAWPTVESPKPCDDEAIRSTLPPGERAHHLVMAYWEDLARAAGQPVTARDDDATLWSIKFSLDTLARMSPSQELDDDNRVYATDVHRTLQERPYLGVLRPVSTSGGLAVSSEEMVSGWTSWGFVLFDVRAGAPVCWSPVRVGNSDHVTYRHAAGASEEAQREAAQLAMRQDLHRRLTERVHEVARELTQVLVLPDNFKY